MPIYVDPLQRTIRNRRWRHTEGCHMISDGTTEALIAFALQLGLKREWLQDQGTYREHFDLTAGKREEAVRKGAHELSVKDFVGMLQKKREARL